MKGKYLFILNKQSGRKRHPHLEKQLAEQCEAQSIKVKFAYTRAIGHATTLAKQGAAERYDAIVAIGGDGTVNEVATGLSGTSTPFAIIPTGSGNGLARHIGMHLKPVRALRQILSGKCISMDTIKINNHQSVNVSGIGFDGHIARLFSAEKKRGLQKYVSLILREFQHYTENPLSLSTGLHQQATPAFILAIANASQFGNNASIAPNASICDHLLRLCIVKKPALWQIPGFVWQLYTKRLNQSGLVTYIQTEEATIKSAEPVAWHIDGETRPPEKAFHIQIQPKALNLIVPSNKGAV